MSEEQGDLIQRVYTQLHELAQRRMSGQPVVRGTRVTVEIILERLASGESSDQILEAYPHLESGDIEAALSFGAKALRADVVYPLSIAGS